MATTATKPSLIATITAKLGSTKYGPQLQAESLPVLTKLAALPANTIKTLLDKAALKAKLSTLRVGQQPELFDAASIGECNVLLWGSPGRGKSMLAEAIAQRHVARVGGIVEQIVCPEDTQVSIIAGSFQPRAASEWEWVYGPVGRALKTGGACICDELAHLSPEASTWLLAAMDRTPRITLPNGEIIEKQPVWFISTQNDTPASLYPALADRHPVRLEVKLPHTWEWLGELAPLAERDLVSDDNATLRPWAALRRMIDRGVTLDRAVPLLWPDSPAQLNAIKLAMDESE